MNEKEIFDKSLMLALAYDKILLECYNVRNYESDYKLAYFIFLSNFIDSFIKFGIDKIHKKQFSNWNMIIKKDETLKEFKEVIENCLCYIHDLDINPPNRRELSEEYLLGNAAGWHKVSLELRWAESKINEI